jgi:hypothetical protein
MVEKLARSLCRGLCRGTSGRLPCWILLDSVLTALAIPRTEPIDTAIAYAISRNWLKADGQPAHSVTMTAPGMAVFRRARRRRPAVRPARSAGA